jgi:enoyl-CoA hydratase
VIVDKDNAPRWRSATPDGVTAARLDDIFAPLALTDEWTPIEETNT